MPGKKLIPDGSTHKTTSTILEQVKVSSHAALAVNRKTTDQSTMNWIGGHESIKRTPINQVSLTTPPTNIMTVVDGKTTRESLSQFTFLHFNNRADAERVASLLSKASGVPVTP